MTNKQTENCFECAQGENEIVTLDFDHIVSFSYITFAYTKPVSFSYFDEKISEVSSWKDLYVQVLFCLMEDYPDKLYKMYNTNINRGKRADFGTLEASKSMTAPRKIRANFYAETSLCASAIVKKIRTLLDECNIDYENLQIKYRKANLEVEDQSTTYDKYGFEELYTEDIGIQGAEQFKKWMINQCLSESQALNYASAIYDCEQLAKLLILSQSIFYGADLESAKRVKAELTKTDAFNEINTRQHNRFGIAMEKYEEFLKYQDLRERSENTDIEKTDSKQKRNVNTDAEDLKRAEEYLIKCDLTGATYDELKNELGCIRLRAEEIVSQSQGIIEMNKRLYFYDTLVDFEDGANEIESIIDRLIKKHDGVITTTLLYEHASFEMSMFLNDNGIKDRQSVYDFARYLFEKINYHGKHYVFQQNKFISLPEVSADSAFSIIKKYAKDKGSIVTYEEIEDYLTGLGLKTGNLRTTMKVDLEPTFLIYSENTYLLSGLLHIDETFLNLVSSALKCLFKDSDGYVILRSISSSWYNLLPTLPNYMPWTPMLLQQMLCFYSDELDARTVTAMESQRSNTLHAMLVEKESWIQNFGDAVAVFLNDEMPECREFEAEKLRKILVNAGMIGPNQLVNKMHIALGNDPRFLWHSDGSHVKIII